MAAAAIKPNAHIVNHNAAVDDGVCINTIRVDIQTNNCRTLNNENENSFCHLPSLKEQSPGDYQDCGALQQTKVPLENFHSSHEAAEEICVPSTRDDQYADNPDESSSQLSAGFNLLQQAAASSPPHSYRHSRAYRHFKNPPQPHMCIRTTSELGEELFINVLSWTRIVIPQEPSDPIPLYGGMRVPPGSPRSPLIVFAVMANPEVLKDSGRHSKDPEERRAMIKLMCDFVEAMNPGVKLVRNAVILKDRDISGELKDVWNAVQAQRDREREEQMLQQRQQQQQHFHNLTTVTTNGGVNTNASQQMFSKSILGGGTKLMGGDGTPPRSRKMLQELQNDNDASNIVEMEMGSAANTTMSLELLAEQLDNKMSIQGEVGVDLSNSNECKDFLESGKQDVNNQLNTNTQTKDNPNKPSLANGALPNTNLSGTATTDRLAEPKTTISENSSSATSASNIVIQQNPAPLVAPPTKKEKLGGFLPNGCIFPRFTKNSKHKDKEGKTKDKEKNVLLSALKKSKDKKSNSAAAIAANHDDKQQQQQEQNIKNITTSTSSITNNTANKQQKNCLQQLESGVQKLDLNHIDNNTASNQKHPPASSTNTTANSNTNNGGVGVH